MSIGERIREARKLSKITQAQLAEKSGVAMISIHQYETGKRRPQIEQIQAIANVLGVSVDYLLNGTYEVDTTHLAKGIHIYRNTSLWGIDLSALDDLAADSYDVKYQDKHIIIAVDKDSCISDEEIKEVVAEYSYSSMTFGSELEKIFKSESVRLGIPEKELKITFLNRKNDGSNVVLNHENISFYFDSIYSVHRKPQDRILSALDKLNLSGLYEAIKRIEELTEIPRYRRQDPPAPHSDGAAPDDE